jgi:hypothetical protein
MNIVIFILRLMKTKIEFDFEMVMGVIEYTRRLRFGGQKFSRAVFIEKAIEKTSNLNYVGLDDTLGHDFVTKELWRLEAKGVDNLFQTDITNNTKAIILKNFQGTVNNNFPEKKFDEMILLDQTQRHVGIVSFENALKRFDPEKNVSKSGLKIVIDKRDVEYLAKNISLAHKKQVKELYHEIVDELYKWEDESDEW